MANSKHLDPEVVIEHADIICGYAEAILDQLTILKAIMAGDEETVALLESLDQP